MSGRTIGSIVGFAIGSMFGAPQLGMFLGSMVGGALKPDVIQGNKVGEIPVQRSQTGGVQPVVLGTSLVDKCVVMAQSAVRIVVEKEEQGKGGGPVVENEVAYQDYTIRVCRSSAMDGSRVQGFVVVFEDGKLVYDARPNPRISAADSAKWKANVTFYYGGEDQEPDPTEEAIDGVGNVSAHRQIARMAFRNKNITEHGNRIPGYEVVVSRCGVTGEGEYPNYLLVTGTAKAGSTEVLAGATAGGAPAFSVIDDDTGLDLANGIASYYDRRWTVISNAGVATSDDNRETWTAGTKTWGFPNPNPNRLVSGPGGSLAIKIAPDGAAYSADATDEGDPLDFAGTDIGGGALEVFFAGGFWWRTYWNYIYRATDKDGPYSIISTYGTLIDIVESEGIWHAIITRGFNGHIGDTSYHSVYRFTSADLTDPVMLLSRAHEETHRPTQLCLVNVDDETQLVAWCFGGGVWTSADNWTAWHDTGVAGAVGPTYLPDGGDNLQIDGGRQIAATGGRLYTIGAGLSDGDKCVVSGDAGVSWGAPITMPIANARSIVASDEGATFTGIELPDSPGHYIDPETGALDGPTLGSSSLCGTTLAEIIDYIALRGQLAATEVDTSPLDDIDVRGITLQSTGSCKDELSPLQLAHFFDPADFDGKLRFRLRGSADVDMVINRDHLILTEDEDQQDALAGQPVEYPLRNNLNYLCVDLDYIRTTATETRTAVQDNVVGAVDNSINEAMSSAEAQRVTAIQLKQAWMAKEGSRKFGLPFEYLELVGASLVSLNGKRGRVDGYTIDPYAIWLDPVAYDRASAASANVVAPELTPPTAPGTSLRGPTDALLMNAPVLADANDKPGITWAAAGYPGMNWRGAVLQVQRGSEWLDLGQITQACGVGTLLADLPAFDGTFDTVNTLQLRANEDIDSITFAALLAEGNPLAILRPDGRTEIMQVQLATETSPGVYACTNLVRGRRDTANAAHLAGARVAILDSRLGFAHLRKDDLGKTLTFRAVSIGTDPDAAPTQTLTLTTMESQREWQPWNVQVEVTETCEHRVTFVGRHRLGTDLNPVQSQWFKGWRIDFTLRGVTHSRMTQEESFLYTREMQVEDWGVALCASYDVAVYAVNEYTGTDGAGNPPVNNDEPFAVTGNLPNGYVGSAYRMFSGDAGFVLTGKSQVTYNDAFGLVGSGVTAHGPEPYSEGFVTRGSPLAAGTYVTNINAGTVGIIAQSVDFAAKPTYSLLDMRWRSWAEGRWADTTPPLTTQVYEADKRSGTGSMWTLAALDSSASNTHVEFVITGAPVYIGINANMPAELTDSAFFSGIVYAGANTAAYLASAGTYAIELVPSTGAWEIIKLGTGVVASGTLALPSGNRYRFGYTVPEPQDSTVYFNAGNAAWLVTATGGFGGMAHPSVVVPVMWLDTSPANSITFGTFGKSSGQWRVQVGGRYRSGLAVSGFDEANGLPGDAGADDSIVFDGATLRWTFGGVADFVDLVWPPSAEPAPVYAIDFAASTVKVCRVDYATGVVSVVHTISGLPAGTWLPFDCRGYLSKQIKHNPAGPAGYSDWTMTL